MVSDKALAELADALRLAVRQNSHDMLMTGEEIRRCEAALDDLRARQPEACCNMIDYFNARACPKCSAIVEASVFGKPEAVSDAAVDRITDYLCEQEYDIGGRDELRKHVHAALAHLSPAAGGEVFVCTGDEIRCHDGHGCECAMAATQPEGRT